MFILANTAQSYGQSTSFFGRYDLHFRCNDNTSQEVVFSLEVPKNYTNKYTIKSTASGVEWNRPLNCVATLEYNISTNTLSGNIYMTKPDDRNFYRNDKFKIKFNGDDSGWFNLEMGDHYDAKCIAEGRIIKINPCSSTTPTLNYHVNVTRISQPTYSTCWAACAAMMLSSHNGVNYSQSIESAIGEIEGKTSSTNSFLGRFKKSKSNGYKDQNGGLIYQEGFHLFSNDPAVDEASQFFIGLMKLQFHNGDIFDLDLKANLPILAARCHHQPTSCKYKNVSSHVIVITGVMGDGTPECTTFKVIDPYIWDDFGNPKPGEFGEDTLTYADLTSCCQAYAFYPKQQLKLNIENGETGKVKTKEGSNLNLRSNPSDKATKIGLIPNGSKVSILQYDDKVSIVNGESGKWYKVQFNGNVGWVWGNFIVLDSLTPKSESFYDLPKKIAEIPIKYQKTITVQSSEVTIYPFDNEKEDGDIVSININGVWVRDQFGLKNMKTNPDRDDLIRCSLNPGKNNYFISRAWNVGAIAPNTLTIKIDDGVSVQEVLINSDIGLSGGIRIVCNK